MKKYLLLSLCLLLGLGAFAQENVTNFFRSGEIPVLNDNGEIVVNPNTSYSYTLKFTVIEGTNNCSVKCSQSPNDQINLEIPSEVQMGETVYNVTAIEYRAFYYNENFIGNLVIPNSITTIADEAFYYCTGFNGTLTLSENLETIGQYAFAGSNSGYNMHFVGDLMIPNSVISIGDYAFYYCTGFNGTLTLSENLETIGQRAFYYCYGFTNNLIIPNSVTSIGDYAFQSCSNFNGTLTLSENLETIGQYAFSGCSKLTGNLVIPNNVTNIGNRAFQSCSNFNGTLTLSENLETIGQYAFSGCSKLTGNLVIPNNVTSIGDYAFQSCSSFNGTLTLSENLVTIGQYAFSGCSKLIGNLTIPNSVTSIGDYVFQSCSGFNGTLIIPESIEVIPQRAFYGCSGIDNLILSDGVKSLGNYSFANCTSLKSVINKSITPPSATSNTFNSSGVTNIFVPEESVDTYSATSPWSNYTVNAILDVEEYEMEITEDGNILYSLIFNLMEDGLNLEVKIGQVPTTNVGLTIPETIDINDSGYVLNVVSIADNAFIDNAQDVTGCELFNSVNIPSTIKHIGDNAFAGCYGVEEIISLATVAPTTGENVFEGIVDANLYVRSYNEYNKVPWNTHTIMPYIKNYEYLADRYSLIFNMLDDNSGLEVKVGNKPTYNTQLNIPESISFDEFGISYNVVKIANRAFSECSKFTSDLVIPNTVVSIADSAFYNCTGFNGTLTLSENLETIGQYAFAGSDYYYMMNFVGDLVIPNSVISIGDYAFNYCSGFNGTLTLSENLKTIGNYAFCGNNAYGGYSFMNYTGDLVIPNSVISIGDGAFGYCYYYNGGTLTLSENLKTIGEEAFSGCSKFTGNLTIPNSVKSIGDEAFYYCTGFNGTLTLSENLETIGQYAFSYCQNFTKMISYAVTPPAAYSNSFNNAFSSGKILFVPEESIDTYSAVSPWSSFTIYDIPNTENYTMEIKDGENVLYSLIFNLKEDESGMEVKIGMVPETNIELTIPETIEFNPYYIYDVVSIADNAFKDETQDGTGCELFTTISIPSTIETIGDNAFAGCIGVTDIVSFAETAPVTGDNCFGGMNGVNLYVSSIDEYDKAPWNAFNLMQNIIDYEYIADGYTLLFNLLDDFSGLEVEIGEAPTSSVELTIPESIYFEDLDITYDVVSIADYGFYECQYFTGNLVIPNTITRVGHAAFYDCNNFNGTLTLSDNLELIGEYAFAGYDNDMSFTGELIIPNTVTSIGQTAFQRCSGFTGDLVIPEGVTSIGRYTFTNCSGFNGTLTLPESLTEIGQYAFNNCGFTSDLVIPDNVTTIDNYAFYQCYGFNGTLKLSKKLTSIGNYAFGANRNYSNSMNFTGSLVIPSNVKNIGEGAFYYCSKLNGDLVLPADLETIGGYAFSYLSSLKNVICYAVTPPVADGSVFQYSYSGKRLFVPEESLDTYKSTTPWKSFSVNSLPNMVDYEIEVTEGENVLYSLIFNLTEDYSGMEVKIGQVPTTNVELTIPEKIEFNQYLAYNVVSIADNAFKDETQDGTGCELFTTISIPSTIETIGDNAFAGCIGVNEIKTSPIIAPATGDNCFGNIPSSTNLFVPYESTGYDVAPWTDFNIIVLAPITDYEYEVKDGNNNVLYTLILNTLEDYSGLEVKIGQAPTTSVELDIPESITFEDYNITYNVVSIADYAFTECVNFVGDLVIPNTVKSIGISAFWECWGFDGTLTLPSNLVSIGDYAFGSYEQPMSFVGELVIPNTVTYLGKTSFQNCNKFTGDLIIPDNVTNIGEYTFYGCTGFMGTLTLPENLTTIGQYAFYYCKFDGALIIPGKVTSIGNSAFRYCSGFDIIASVSLTPPSASSNTFSNTNLSTLYVQAEAVNAYYNEYPWYNFNIYAAVPFISNLKESSISCSTEKYFDIEMFNCSTDDIASIKFEIFIDDVKKDEFTWEGSIEAFKMENIEFNAELTIGTHEVTAKITEINGVEFENSKTVEVVSEEVKYAYVEGDEGEFTIDIMKFNDNYGGTAISWELYASDNSLIGSGSTTNQSVLYSDVVSIPAGECVKFVISKNNNYSVTGYYRILDSDGNVVLYNEGNFATRSSYLLSVNSDEDIEDSYAQNTFVVEVETPGILSYKLATMAEQWSDVYTLKVNGNINTEDMEVFYKLINLAVLDLSETNITNIGGCHDLKMLRTVILPSTVTTVDTQAFSNCLSLKSINVPNVTTVANNAFYNCHSLASIETPNVETIGNNAFYYCYALNSIDLPNVESIGDQAFYYCYNLASVNAPNLVTLGGNNNSGYGGIFEDCERLSSVTLSDNITSIPYRCFQYCSSLKEIVLPNSLTSIANYAFSYSALTDIAIPEGVKTIGYYAFSSCPLTNISIPSTIEYIDNSSFYYCNSIADVYCYAMAPITTSTFNGGITTATLHVPAISVITYRLHDSWYKFENIVPIDEDVVDVNINSDFIIVDYEGLADEINLNLNMNAHLTVSAESELNINNYTQLCSNTSYYTNTGGQQIYYYPSTLITDTDMNADNVELTLNLHTNRWNFISLPFDVDVTDIEYPEGTLWVIRKYSGEDRANMSENTWHNVTDGMLLNAGEGYILHCIRDDYNFVKFTFNALDNENKNNIFKHQDVEQPLEVYPSEYAHNRSWNLVGNPYPSYFNINGNIEHNGIITVWGEFYDEWGYSNGAGYVAYSLLDDYYTLKPYESFFVQCPDDATSMLFKTEGRSHTNDYEDYSKRDEAFRQRNSGDRKIYNFTLNNEEYSDRTRLVLNEAASVDYELSCDASKFMNDNNEVPQIYIFDNEVRYAINERPLFDGLMSVGIRIGQTGEYTLTLDPKEEYNEKVVLYDNETGEEIDILNESYTFFAEEGYDDDRFVLSVTGNTIGIEENVVLDINDSDVEVYDIYGRRVRVSDAKNGLYILRKGDKVQKCFINE